METQTTILLLRWHEGDHQALDDLLKNHLAWITDRVRRRLGPLLLAKAEAEDYVAETVLEFLEHGPRLVLSDGAHFRALLAKIAENVLRGNHRWWTAARRDISRERALPADSVLMLDAPSAAGERDDREALVRLALELVEPDQREIVVLRNYQHLSYAQIAERLGTTANAAQKRYWRAFVALSRTVGALQRRELSTILGDLAQPE